MIICAGESLIDMVSFRGEAEYTPHVGGSNFNSSIALGRLGADSYYFGAISNDSYGELIENTLRHSKVKEDFVIKTNRPTTLAYADVIEGIAEYTFVDEHSAGRLLDTIEPQTFSSWIEKGKGIIGWRDKSSSRALRIKLAVAYREVSGHLPIYFDANIRPDFIEDKQSFFDRFIELTSKVDIIKISDEDYRYLYGAQDFSETSKSWLNNGVKLVILTLGSDGAKVLYRDHEVSVQSNKVDVLDTIAAGDTFNAGFLLSLDKQGLLDRESLNSIGETQLKTALTFANKVASITVTKKGANPPWLEEL